MNYLINWFNNLSCWKRIIRVWGFDLESITFDRWLNLHLHRLGWMGFNEKAFLSMHIRPGMHILDVGANQGLYSCLFASLVGPQGKVMAFEPEPCLYRALESNVSRNGFNNIHCFPLGLSNVEETASLFRGLFNSGDNRIRSVAPRLAGNKVDVRLAKGDDIVADEKIDFIKIDVQGYEPSVLKGLEGVLRRSPAPMLYFEFWPNGLKEAGFDPLYLFKFLQSLNYEMFIIRDKSLCLVENGNLPCDLHGSSFVNIFAKENPMNDIKVDLPKTTQESEVIRLGSLARHQETTTGILGFDVIIPDGPSFIAVWKEVFSSEIYKFNCNKSNPRILDCGANVGVSVLYFKQLYPEAKITAFEPDPTVFKYLEKNIKISGHSDITLVQKAVWSSESTLDFYSEKSDAGRIEENSQVEMIRIETVRLRDYLREFVDFLKIDIEGAESEVLFDSQDMLKNVGCLFVEYHSFANKPQLLGKILTILADSGFRVQIQPMLVSPKPFLQVNEYMGMDLQLNIFCYRS